MTHTRPRGIALTADQVRELLPQRHPILLLDRVIELDPGVSAVGIKNVTINEPYFQGHFPERFIMPGTCIIEASAQLSAALFAVADRDDICYLGEVKNFKFTRLVTPGDQLNIFVQCTGGFGPIKQVQVQVQVDGQPVASGTIMVTTDASSKIGG